MDNILIKNSSSDIVFVQIGTEILTHLGLRLPLFFSAGFWFKAQHEQGADIAEWVYKVVGAFKGALTFGELEDNTILFSVLNPSDDVTYIKAKAVATANDISGNAPAVFFMCENEFLM